VTQTLLPLTFFVYYWIFNLQLSHLEILINIQNLIRSFPLLKYLIQFIWQSFMENCHFNTAYLFFFRGHLYYAIELFSQFIEFYICRFVCTKLEKGNCKEWNLWHKGPFTIAVNKKFGIKWPSSFLTFPKTFLLLFPFYLYVNNLPCQLSPPTPFLFDVNCEWSPTSQIAAS